LYLSIAAAGIPLDRITIVLGALGVGIGFGFGLQTLVNNLVSGLILAFEKPVNVGDVVDIDGQGGTMKSIGFWRYHFHNRMSIYTNRIIQINPDPKQYFLINSEQDLPTKRLLPD
jgi:small-conductance mechanosensitive channel